MAIDLEQEEGALKSDGSKERSRRARGNGGPAAVAALRAMGGGSAPSGQKAGTACPLCHRYLQFKLAGAVKQDHSNRTITHMCNTHV